VGTSGDAQLPRAARGSVLVVCARVVVIGVMACICMSWMSAAGAAVGRALHAHFASVAQVATGCADLECQIYSSAFELCPARGHTAAQVASSPCISMASSVRGATAAGVGLILAQRATPPTDRQLRCRR